MRSPRCKFSHPIGHSRKRNQDKTWQLNLEFTT
uniref:Uncharacterized protein n=1 Tax=Arundo donax TaxID=35708 RepID=A0A0A9GIN5_ARUDO